MIINNKFNLGQVVYLRTDIEQQARIVTLLEISPGGTIIYGLTCGTQDSKHFDIEITEERDALMAAS